MNEAASGGISNRLSLLRATLAGSETFRELVGELYAEEALRHIRFFGIDRPLPWSAESDAALGQVVLPTTRNDFVYECAVEGETGAEEPDWPTESGDEVEDGEATWAARPILGKDAYVTAIRLARPFALVGLGENFDLVQSGAGAGNSYSASGKLLLFIEADAPAEYSEGFQDAGMWWANLLGGIVGEMSALAGRAGYLDITGFHLSLFERMPEEARRIQGDALQAEWIVDWRGL